MHKALSMASRQIHTQTRCSHSATRSARCSINSACEFFGDGGSSSARPRRRRRAPPSKCDMSQLKISEMPQEERPREKLASRGASALADSELIAILLRTGIPGANAIEIGRRLLEQY